MSLLGKQLSACGRTLKCCAHRPATSVSSSKPGVSLKALQKAAAQKGRGSKAGAADQEHGVEHALLLNSLKVRVSSSRPN